MAREEEEKKKLQAPNKEDKPMATRPNGWAFPSFGVVGLI
jgi:hypothetical protein